MKRDKVIVSACLLGEACRYDGCSKKDTGVIEFLKDKEVIPFCPEAPVLGTPRGRISVVATEDHGLRVRKDADGTDVTDAIIDQIESLIEAHPDATMIILKSKSPSCGLGTTPMLDEAGNEIGKGNGIAADMLLHAFPDIEIVDENTFLSR
jgi:uncharacterized protein YbbK (DUF523 family)